MRFAQFLLILFSVIATGSMLVYHHFIPFNISYLAVEVFLVLLLILIFRIFYLRDTYVDSPFFSIDRVRTIRFVTAYYLVIFISSFAILLAFFLVLGGITGIIMALLITILNLLVGIYGLFILIFTGSFPGFVDYELVLVVVNFIFETSQIYSTNFGVVLGGIFALIAISISAYVLGRYVEDKDTALATVIFTHLLIAIVSFLLILSNFWYTPPESGILISPEYYLLTLIPLTIPYSYYLSSKIFQLKENKDEYDLPAVKPWVRRISFVIMLLFLALSVFSSIYGTVFFITMGSTWPWPPLIGNAILAILATVSSMLLAIWVIRGDFPVAERIFEIEYREELLEKAKSFQDI